MFGKGLRFVGNVRSFDEVVIDGAVADLKFVAYYVKDGKVKAVSTMASDPAAAGIASLMKCAPCSGCGRGLGERAVGWDALFACFVQAAGCRLRFEGLAGWKECL